MANQKAPQRHADSEHGDKTRRFIEQLKESSRKAASRMNEDRLAGRRSQEGRDVLSDADIPHEGDAR